MRWGSGTTRVPLMIGAAAALLWTAPALAAPVLDEELPLLESLQRVIFLRDYNTRVVMTGTVLLGIAAGLIGTFMLLRRRALIGDALSHATLPGIAIAFMAAVIWGADGKSLPLLLIGAGLTGLLGVLVVLMLRHSTRIKEDSAMGIVLSVFFGAGVALLGIAQRMEQGHAAGLESFIYGKTASMVASDAMIIAIVAAVAIGVSAILYKEFRLLCFDQSYARSQGWPVMLLDIMLMTMVTLVTVIGLQAVGLVLVIALLVIPSAAARFWTHRLWKMLLVAAGIGAISCYTGTIASAIAPDLPSGAIIVLASAVLFALSMVFGPAGGLLHRWHDHAHLQKTTSRQNVLRALFELLEDRVGASTPDPIPTVPFEQLLAKRSWTASELRRELRLCRREGLVVEVGDGRWRPTVAGLTEARRVARQHRMWELYLITHADVAPSHVDRSADMIEHVLGVEIMEELEAIMDGRAVTTLASPHAEDGKGGATHA